MEHINVKFGTPKPIKFREYDKDYPKLDLELEFRAAGTADVSAYDSALYESDAEVVLKIKESAPAALAECVGTWKEGSSLPE